MNTRPSSSKFSKDTSGLTVEITASTTELDPFELSTN